MDGRLREGALLVHQAALDVPFLRRAYKRSGLRWPAPPVVDTVALLIKAAKRARFVNPDAPEHEPELNLAAARRRLGLPDYGVARRADRRGLGGGALPRPAAPGAGRSGSAICAGDRVRPRYGASRPTSSSATAIAAAIHSFVTASWGRGSAMAWERVMRGARSISTSSRADDWSAARPQD